MSMSIIQNVIYTGLFTTGSVFYASNEFSKQEIDAIILQLRTQTESPYDEVMDLMNLTEEKPQIFSSTNSKYAETFMTQMENWTDADWLAKMLFTERSNPKDSIELRYIAATAIHRALLDGITIAEVCANKKQYSGVMRNKNRHWISEPWDIHKQVAKDMLKLYQKGIPSDIGRIFAFCNIKVVKKINPKALRWFNTLDKITEYNQDGHVHTFFGNKYWDEFLKNNPDAKLTKKHFKKYV